MGRDVVKLKITATLSRHNSEDDIIDNELWEEIKNEIRCLLETPEYERISPMLFG